MDAEAFFVGRKLPKGSESGSLQEVVKRKKGKSRYFRLKPTSLDVYKAKPSADHFDGDVSVPLSQITRIEWLDKPVNTVQLSYKDSGPRSKAKTFSFIGRREEIAKWVLFIDAYVHRKVPTKPSVGSCLAAGDREALLAELNIQPYIDFEFRGVLLSGFAILGDAVEWVYTPVRDVNQSIVKCPVHGIAYTWNGEALRLNGTDVPAGWPQVNGEWDGMWCNWVKSGTPRESSLLLRYEWHDMAREYHHEGSFTEGVAPEGPPAIKQRTAKGTVFVTADRSMTWTSDASWPAPVVVLLMGMELLAHHMRQLQQ